MATDCAPAKGVAEAVAVAVAEAVPEAAMQGKALPARGIEAPVVAASEDGGDVEGPVVVHDTKATGDVHKYLQKLSDVSSILEGKKTAIGRDIYQAQRLSKKANLALNLKMMLERAVQFAANAKEISVERLLSLNKKERSYSFEVLAAALSERRMALCHPT